MENCIPKFWEREWEWEIAFPTFGNGNGNEKIIPNFWEREWEAGIPGNGREREFPLTPATNYQLFLQVLSKHQNINKRFALFTWSSFCIQRVTVT